MALLLYISANQTQVGWLYVMAALAAGGAYLAAVGDDKTLHLWALADGQLAGELKATRAKCV